MEEKTMKRIITILLRLVGVLTIFIGLILITQILVQLILAYSAMPGIVGMSIKGKGIAGIIVNSSIAGHTSIVAWGFILMAYAKAIAKSITKE